MNRKAHAVLEQYNMLSSGSQVVAGVSGGADSMALLQFLCSLRETMQIYVAACHLNHSLRGEESQRDQALVQAYCSKKNVPCFVKTLDIAALAKASGQSVEEEARNQRYAFFAEAARQLGSGAKIATAHTHTDSLETFFLNLVRGTGLDGLCGIPPVRDNIIRPLITCTRAEIEQYCAEQEVPFVVDSTNLQENYTRNRIRHRLVPILKELNPALEEKTAGTLALLRQDQAYLNQQAQKALLSFCKEDLCCRKTFLELEPAVGQRALVLYFRHFHVAYDSKRLQLVFECIEQGAGRVQMGQDLWFCASKDRFWLEEPDTIQPYFEAEVSLPQQESSSIIPLFDGKAVQLRVIEYEYFEKSSQNPQKLLKNAIDYDKIDRIIKIRQRNFGDSYRPQRRGCSKSLKKLLNESGLSLSVRSRLLVLQDQAGIAWVEGFGADERCKVDSATTKLLEIKILEDL